GAAGDHVGDFLNARFTAQLLDTRLRAAGLDRFRNAQVPFGERRDRGQVRDAQDLVLRRDAPQVSADRGSEAAADAGVDLVEDQRAVAVRAAEHAAQREHDARSLAAGSYVAQARETFSGIGGEQEFDAIHPAL